MGRYNAFIEKIDEKELRRYAGISRITDDSMDEYVKKALYLTKLHTKGLGIYEHYKYDDENNTILAPSPLVLSGKSITKHLKGCKEIYIMAVTIGKGVEDLSSKAFLDGDYTLGVIIDAGGTTAVEQVADKLNDYLKSLASKKGMSTTFRFSPGYGDWEIECQDKILKLAGGEKIGISLTSSKMLNPQKSVTAIIGIKNKNENKDTKKGCSICNMKNCSSRK